MKLDIPLYIQPENSNDCGPITLKMIFSYFGKEFNEEKIKRLSILKGEGQLPL